MSEKPGAAARASGRLALARCMPRGLWTPILVAEVRRMAVDAADIHEGMQVRGRTGERLGTVFAIGERQFELERGWFRVHDYLVRVEDVDALREGELFLRGGAELLREDVDEGNASVESTADAGLPARGPDAGVEPYRE